MGQREGDSQAGTLPSSLAFQPQCGSKDDLGLVIMGKPKGTLSRERHQLQPHRVPSPPWLIAPPKPWPSTVMETPPPARPQCCFQCFACVLPCPPRTVLGDGGDASHAHFTDGEGEAQWLSHKAQGGI